MRKQRVSFFGLLVQLNAKQLTKTIFDYFYENKKHTVKKKDFAKLKLLKEDILQ